MAESTEDKVAPIAVVGMGCRFPGTATSDSSLWEMMMAGESAWSEIPKDRMDITSYYHPDNARQGSIPFRGGHFLQQDVAAFDNSFFSISADEAKAIDPQQRMLLEVAVESLDSAGIDRAEIRGSETGVWIGSFVKDYEQVVLRDPDNAPKYGATGNGIAIMSNRISYFLDINGPSMTIDTGCSASLVCVHNAAQSLRDGEVDLALAGGAGLILTPATMMPMTALNFLSPDGRCYTFDSRANGYGRGEGIGIVVLKRLKDAIADNDTIRAVIRGSRVNQDGRTAGITMPSSEAQVRNIRGVYERAGLDVDKTAFVECHGTGTKAGDWREVKAISDALCADREKDNPIYIGSIKTNLGHLEGCAGIAGLIKGVLAIENGYIPKHLNFETPNPDIDFEGSRVKVAAHNTRWPLKGLRRASINCFGFGGTNAHAILDDAPNYLAERRLEARHNTTILEDDPLFEDIRRILERRKYADPPKDETQLFVVSANDKLTLERSLRNLAEYVQNHGSSHNFMKNLAYTLGCRRTKLQWRASVVASSPEDLVQKLSRVGPASLIRTSEEKQPKVALVFGGQGAQWFAMARELLDWTKFYERMIEAQDYLFGLNIVKELRKDEASSRINEPQFAQPATTVIQICLIEWLWDFEIDVVAVCGHSSGEIAAAYARGALEREAALELACNRGRCVAALQEPRDEGNDEEDQTRPLVGRMLAVGMSAEQAQPYVDAVGWGKVTIACINSPVSVTLSGDEDAVLSIHETLDKAGVFNRLLAVTTAYHSRHMYQCAEEYFDSIREIPQWPTGSSPVMYSSVTGNTIDAIDLQTGRYWVRNMVSPVLFSEAMTNMVTTSDASIKPDIILELGPHSSLQSPIKQILDAQEKLRQKPVYFSMLSRHKAADVTALEVLGELWSRGCNIDLKNTIERVHDRRLLPKLLVNLPKYPWNHEKTHWHESHLSKANRFQKHGRYDLIGRPTADSIPSQPRWRGFLRLSENPWIRHHQVQKTIIYPAAGMIAMVLEGADQMADEFVAIEIKQFRIQKAMIIPPTAHGLEFAVNMTKHTGQHGMPSIQHPIEASENTAVTYQFYIYSKPLDAPWQEHGDGLVVIHQEPTQTITAIKDKCLYSEECSEAMDFCDEVVIPRQLYETLDVIGMNYGAMFQNITSLRKRDSECIGTVRVPDTKSIMPSNFEYPHIIHPATLDAVFHTAFAIGSEPMVPSYIGSIYVTDDIWHLSNQGGELMVRTRAERLGSRDASAHFTVSETLQHADGDPIEPMIIIEDMTFTALTTSSDDVEGGFLPNHRSLCSEIKWEEHDESALSPEELASEDEESPLEFPDTPVLILVPETMSTGLQNVLSVISKYLNGTPRTLTSISNDDELPRMCLSFLDADGDGQSVLWDLSEQEFTSLRAVVLKTSGLFWITRNSQMVVDNPRGGLFQALARTIHSEYPEKKFVTFDISWDISSANMDAGYISSRILLLLHQSLFATTSTDVPQEVEYAERDGPVMIPRLVPVEFLNTLIERGTAMVEQPQMKPLDRVRDKHLKLKAREIGNPDSFFWEDDTASYDPPVGPYEVRVRVLSAALSILDMDVMKGRKSDGAIGTDVFGVVEELGVSVTDLAIGDYVLGVARGSFDTKIVCHRKLLYKCPAGKVNPFHVFFPTPFAVAQYSFGLRLNAGEIIVIHAGASAFGQAAIQLAESIGAHIFVTVKSQHERTILRGIYELPDERILDASTDSWVSQLLSITRGKGADVVYDPIIEDGDLEVRGVAPGGRIIRFARHINYRARFKAADASISFDGLNLVDLIRNPDWIGAAFDAVADRFFTGSPDAKPAEPSPLKLFDFSQLPLAVKTFANDPCGLVYLQRDYMIPVPILSRRPAGASLHSDSTYVIAGGLGGLGIEIAKLLTSHGVKHIAFLARSGARTEIAKASITFLQKRSVEVAVYTVDICEEDQMASAVQQMKAQGKPPVRGVFQCAAALHDAVFENMTYANWRTAVRPKTIGSWNLKKFFYDAPARTEKPDFFIFLSSSAGVIGSRGQANYAVGNAFQDALAKHLNSKIDSATDIHTRAVSLDLGPVLGAGMLAEDPRTLDILKASGFFGIRLQDVLKLVERAIADEDTPAQVVIGVGTGGLILQNKPADPYWTRTALFSRLNLVDMPASSTTTTDGDTAVDSTTGQKQSVAQMLKAAADPEEATAVVSTGLRTMLSKSMNVGVDDVDENRSPGAYGVDSLVAVGVRNWVYRECGGVDVSVFDVLSDQSILELSGLIVQKGGFGA
ncbi:Type I Iterative PKS [Diatrype stigma]|uniref:Type I Iterative PKS n=1 Tax=Diatrype stigma TaxID=117547 RepID=A0AAN9V219_9PEZI